MTVDIANRLVQLRKEHHLSQEELAEKIGLSRQAVSKWERAEASPDTDNLILLSRLYGVSIDELLRTDTEDTVIVESEQASQSAQAAQSEPAAPPRKRVHIGYKGIHVEDGEDYVHVGWDGIRVIEKEGHEVDFAKGRLVVDGEEVDYKKEALYRAPIAIAVTVAFLLIGFLFHLWHPGWVIFLLIPVLESLVTAVNRHDPGRFAYPVLATYIFLCIGFLFGMWHPTWVIFLTIPVYYAIFPARSKDGEVSFGAVPDDLKDEFKEE